MEKINIENINFIEEKISSIVSDIDFALDIEVEDVHHYILENGIISHNSSVFANNVSGGLEPLFMPKYIRTTIMSYAPEGLIKPKNIDWENKKFDIDDPNRTWEWLKEGDENILKTEFGGYVWKMDKPRGLLRETWVKDYAVRYLEGQGEWYNDDPSKGEVVVPEWAATSPELTIAEHLNTMEVIAKYIDAAMSKTINLPNNYSFDDFKTVYADAYKTGVIKGVTTYRIGTMAAVLSSGAAEASTGIQKTKAIKRPRTLKCDIHHLTVQGNDWIVLVGLMGEDPYEVFALKKKNIQLSQKWKEGKLTKVKTGHYNLEIGDDFIIENIAENFESDEQEALTRIISNSLQCGTDINSIYDQLCKSQGTVISFSKAIARSFKKYINLSLVKEGSCPSCGAQNSMIMAEGCFKCSNCAWSKCS